MKKNNICIGIDLGTTNTSAACSTINAEGEVSIENLKIRQKGNGARMFFDKLPSIMYIKENGETVVGFEAKDLKENRIMSAMEKPRYIENSKLKIGTREVFELDGRSYSPIDIAAEILKHVKNYSDIKNMKSDYSTIITVPANFRTPERNATLEAARRAGFKDVELYDEPKAAILSFLHELHSEIKDTSLDFTTQKRILVIDIGGGTCDICVEDVVEKDGQYVFTHRAVGRDNIGGVDFDTRIGDELVKNKLSGIKLSDSEIAAIRDMGQKIKEFLSDDIKDFVWENYDNDDAALYMQYNWLDIIEQQNISCSQSRDINNQSFIFSMNVREMVNAISPLIYHIEEMPVANKLQRDRSKNMEALVNKTLAEYSIDIDSVDMIFLTGGMAKCFPLKAALYELYQKPIISPADPLLAVSRGAALLNKYRSIDESSKDIMPNAIMMEMEDGTLETLIHMGEPVPVAKTVDKIFETQSGKGVVIRLFEGKNQFDSNLRRINTLFTIEFENIKSPKRQFKIGYRVDKTKRIRFQITFLDNNESYNIDGQIKEGK